VRAPSRILAEAFVLGAAFSSLVLYRSRQVQSYAAKIFEGWILNSVKDA
jgi:hypothetical protein